MKRRNDALIEWLIAAICLAVLILATILTARQRAEYHPPIALAFSSFIAAPQTPQMYLPLFVKDVPPVDRGWKGVAVPSQFRTDSRYFNCNAICEMGIDTYYAYVPNPPTCTCNGRSVEAIPMLFDPSIIGQPLDGNSTRLLVGNEWDLLDVSPEDAAAAFREVQTRYPDVDLVLPGAYNFNYVKLMWSYHEYIYSEPPQAYALALHIYPQGWTFPDAKRETRDQVSRAVSFARRHGLKVLVTEVAYADCMPGCDEKCTLDYIEWLPTYLRGIPEIDGVFWFPLTYNDQNPEPWSFGSCTVPLMNFADGTLTQYGREFAKW